MLDKLKNMSQLAGLLGNSTKIREEIERFQEKVGQMTAEGDAGGGMVQIRMNGRFEVLSCKLSDEAMADKELLQDLLAAAINQAIERVRRLLAEETSRMVGNMGLPAGMNFPGMPFTGA